MSKQPEALRLADSSGTAETLEYGHTDEWIIQASAELRRLHSINAELLEALRVVSETGNPGSRYIAREAIRRATEEA